MMKKSQVNARWILTTNPKELWKEIKAEFVKNEEYWKDKIDVNWIINTVF